MEVTDNDKVALLEFLGYGLFKDSTIYTHEKGVLISMDEFNPLDMTILLMGVDIIEKKWYTRLDKDEDGKHSFYIGYYDYPNYKGNGSTREEAILKAILAYIKQTKYKVYA